jgi:hypothetical protein
MTYRHFVPKSPEFPRPSVEIVGLAGFASLESTAFGQAELAPVALIQV